MQKGLRESLLCEKCENRFSVYERYASMFLNGGVGITVQREGDRLYLTGLDYNKLKLFQLSILWRASISSLSSFAQVKLGPHADRIRTMLLADEPGTEDVYGCLMFVLMHENVVMPDIIVSPTFTRLDSLIVYRFVFGGLVFLYVVSSTPPPKFLAEHFLKKLGTAIVKLQQVGELGFVVDTVNMMQRMGKLSK